jgi:hypothetical protein
MPKFWPGFLIFTAFIVAVCLAIVALGRLWHLLTGV